MVEPFKKKPIAAFYYGGELAKRLLKQPLVERSVDETAY